MKQGCDCGVEGCKGHGRNLHIKDRLWFLFWGVFSISFMVFLMNISDVRPIPLDKYLIGFTAGLVVSGVFFVRFDD